MIIFLNGSINSGKTTIAKILVNKIPNTAHIEVDNLREFISWMPLDESITINLENTISLVKNFLKRELNVIVTYPLSQSNFDYLQDKLKDVNDLIYVFTLNPNLETVLSRDKRLSNYEKERIKYHYQIGINKPSFGVILDTTNQTSEETASVIMSQLK